MTQAWSASPTCGAASPTPGRVAHRVGHVVEQPVEELAEAVDRQALQPEPRVTEEDDRSDAHGRQYSAGSAAVPADHRSASTVRRAVRRGCPRPARPGRPPRPRRRRRRAPSLRAARGVRVASPVRVDACCGGRRPTSANARPGARWRRPSHRPPCGRAARPIRGDRGELGGLRPDLADDRCGLGRDVVDHRLELAEHPLRRRPGIAAARGRLLARGGPAERLVGRPHAGGCRSSAGSWPFDPVDSVLVVSSMGRSSVASWSLRRLSPGSGRPAQRGGRSRPDGRRDLRRTSVRAAISGSTSTDHGGSSPPSRRPAGSAPRRTRFQRQRSARWAM